MYFKFESEIGKISLNPSDVELDQLLAELDGINNSYASLSNADGSYIQVGGGPDRFTVEIRKVMPDYTFRHLKAILSGPTINNCQLYIGGMNVSVPGNCVLNYKLVYQLFISFLNGTDCIKSVDWQDITSMFD